MCHLDYAQLGSVLFESLHFGGLQTHNVLVPACTKLEGDRYTKIGPTPTPSVFELLLPWSSLESDNYEPT
jgi:hypothetical protein